MTLQYQQSNQRLRVRFYRAYLGNATDIQPAPTCIEDWLRQVQSLGYNGQPSRYHEIGNGRRVYTEIDHHVANPMRFRIYRTTYQGIPPAESSGKIDTAYLRQGQGLVDTWYGCIFNHSNTNRQPAVIAITIRGNTAPNNMLREYIQAKLPSDTANLKIEQLAHNDILARLASMGDGTLFEISIKPSFVETMRAVDSSLADSLQASQNVYEQYELTQSIKPAPISRFGLRARFQGVIGFILGAEEHRTQVTRLRIGGMFGSSTRATVINLLSDDLSVEIDFHSTDPVFAIPDLNDVYNAIQDAYYSMEDAIDEAMEASGWLDGTSEDSSVQTAQQPALFQ